MPTNFPNGISSYGIPVIGSGQIPTTTGSYFFVDSNTGNAGYTGKTPQAPLATLAGAIAKCTASKGDVIVLMPGHSETVASSISINVAGITIVGLGSGSLRPTFNITGASATLAISAANITVNNILVTGGVDEIVAAITISAADVKLVNLEYRDVTGQCTDCILTTAAATRLLIDNLVYDGATAAGTNAAIAIVGGDGITIRNVVMDGNFAVGGIDVRTTATTDLNVYNVRFRTRNAADIFLVDTVTASTGNIGPNIYIRLQDNAANITEAITGATWVQHQDISVVNNAGEIGMAINTTASTDA